MFKIQTVKGKIALMEFASENKWEMTVTMMANLEMLIVMWVFIVIDPRKHVNPKLILAR